MNIGEALAGGLASMGGTAEKIGLDGVRSAIEESRAARLAEMSSEIKMRDEQTGFDRKVARAPEENRMAAEAATSRAESELSFKEGSQGRTQAMADADSEADLARKEKQQPRVSGLINAGKSNSLAWEQENAGTVNKLAKDKARATHIDDGAELRAIQIKAAQLALDEKEAEVKMPYAAKQAAAGKRDQIKSTEAAIDKAIAEQSPGLDALQAKQAKQQDELSEMYRPFLPEGMKTKKPAAKTDLFPPKQNAAGGAKKTEPEKSAVNPAVEVESAPRKGLIASARETFGEGGTMQSSATDARERALLPQIKAKIDRGYKLTAEESKIADRLKLR